MGRKGSGGWLILGLIGLGLFKCGDTTKTPTPPMVAYSPVPAVSHVAPVHTAYSQPAAQPPAAARSPFAEPTTNGYRGEPAAEARPIRRSLYVRGKEVPMRSAPDAKARILNRLPNGMEVGELSRREGWVQIRHPISAVEGWISTRRLGEAPPKAEEVKTEEQPKPKKTERPGVRCCLMLRSSPDSSRSTLRPTRGIAGARRTRIERAGGVVRGVRTLSPVAESPYVMPMM